MLAEIEHRGLDLPALEARAAALARALAAARSPDEAITVGLVGDLGAGKTTFSQAFVAALPGGSGLRVTSPTYAILQRYPTEPPVRHVDLYRVGGLEELEAIGYDEELEAPGLNLVEWARAVPDALPQEWVEIALAVGLGDVRDMRVRAHGGRTAHILGMKVPHS